MMQAEYPVRETPDIVTASDDYASRFSGPAGTYFLEVQNQAVARVLGNVPSGSTLLDLGGGHAQLLGLLKEMGRVTEAGSDDSCHERVRREHPEVSCTTVDLLNLPFSDQSFDYVVSVRLISHMQNWPRLIAEMCRVAKTGVIIDYPSWASLNILTPLLFALKKNIEGNTRSYLSFYQSQLMREFIKHGFGKSRSRKQFFWPMFIHRKLNGAAIVQTLEKVASRFGLTALLGSPVILRADRLPPD